MAEFKFTGTSPRLMFGLIQGVNATVRPATPDAPELSDGQTVVLFPGDNVTIDIEYDHAELAEVAPPETPPATTPKPTTTKGTRK